MLNIHNATLSHKFLLYPILKSKYLRHFFRDLEIFYIRPGVGWAGILDNRSFLVGLVADRSSWFGISCFGAETPPPTNCGGRPIITQVGGILCVLISSSARIPFMQVVVVWIYLAVCHACCGSITSRSSWMVLSFYLLVERLVRCVWLCVEQTHLLMPYLAFGQPYPVATSHAGPVEWIVSHMAGESGLVCWVWCCVQEWSGSCMWCGREVLSVWSCVVCCHVDGREWQVVCSVLVCVCVRVCAYLLSRLVTTTE